MGSHISRDSSSREALDSLRRIVQTLRESSRRAEQQLGISGAQLFVLEQLADTPAQSLNELAAGTFTHQSSVSTVVSRLVERGLVTRAPSAEDGRRMEIAISDRGRGVLQKAPRTAQTSMQEALRRMDPAQVRALADGLQALVREGGFAEQPVPMFFEEEGAGS